MKKVETILIFNGILLVVGCTQNFQRYGSVIVIKEEMLERIKRLKPVLTG